MPKTHFCFWCWAPIRVPDDFNDNDHKAVCSVECAHKEKWFTRRCSDEQLGLLFYQQHGVNPNHLGGNNG